MFGNINAAFDSLAECWKVARSMTSVCGSVGLKLLSRGFMCMMGTRPYRRVFLPCFSNYSMQLFVLRHEFFTCELVIYNIFRLSVVSMQINNWATRFLK